MKAEQKRMILAMVLSALVLIGWEKFFAPKVKITKTETILSQKNNTSQEINSDQYQNKSNTNNTNKKEIIQKNDSNTKIKIKQLSITNNNRSSVIIDNNFNIYKYKNSLSKDLFIKTVGHMITSLFVELNTKDIKVVFDKFEKVSDSQISATDSNLGIYANFLMKENKVFYNLQSTNNYKYIFYFKTKKKETTNHQIRQFLIYNTKDVDFFNINSDKNGDIKTRWFGVDFDYNLFVNVLKTEQNILYTIKNNTLKINLTKANSNIRGYLLYTRKSYDLLKDQLSLSGENLQMAINFGFFGIVAVPLLKCLKFFYKYLHNYGLSILLLTILLRFLTFPLQFKSFKSMKKMQIIQPEIQKIKEKYKKDTVRQQKETMALFKKAGANPLGGCLPMLLQMPIFFAFYKMLYSSIELVHAPFYFWITDLSVKDPYYVLPIMMAISMFFQNKLNPSASADPNQKKIMLFMPFIFGFMMKDLPAGLNLYMAVSMALGSAQQLMVYRFVKE